jgi:hypothetical protein
MGGFVKTSNSPQGRFWTTLAVTTFIVGLGACGGDKKESKGIEAGGEASISGTITVDSALKEKIGKAPLLMIMASNSPEPNKPAVIVKRAAEVTFPYDYKLTAEDITLVGTKFDGKMYLSARIDPAGMVGAPGPGTFEGIYPGNPVPVGSSKIDIVINKAY